MTVCMRASPLSKRKTARAINTKLGRRILHCRYIDPVVKRSKSRLLRFLVCILDLKSCTDRLTEGYSSSDLTSLAKDAALGPIRGEQ